MVRSIRKAARRWWVSLITLIIVAPISTAWAQGSESELNQIKAAFVVNIARFVKWPEDASNVQPDQITLCIYRDENLLRSARSFAGQIVDGRQLQVQKVSTLASASQCGVLLVPNNHVDGYQADLESAGGVSALTVIDQTDADGPPKKAIGTMVTLVRNKAKIGFDVDLAAVDDSGLKISSQLLRLARSVHRGDST